MDAPDSMPLVSEKEKVMKKYLISVLAFAVLGCATPTQESVNKKWRGQMIENAIRALGPPQYTTPLPNGITIYTWEQEYGAATAPVRGFCRTGLHADASGKIVDASQISRSLLCK